MRQWLKVFVIVVMLWTASQSMAADDQTQADLQALKARVAQLESQLQKQSYQQRSAELLSEMVSGSSMHPAADSGVTAGYDKRFFIKTTDDQFKLEIDTRLQARHTYALSDDGDDRADNEGLRGFVDGVDPSASAFEFERARIYFTGHVLKDLNYKLMIELDDEGGTAGRLQEAEVSYSFCPALGIRVGRFKNPFGRQETTSSGRQMMVERSLANEVFNTSRGNGVALFGALAAMDTNIYWEAAVTNGFNDENKRTFSQTDNNPAVSARATMPLMGATPEDFVNESDLMFHDNPVAQVGVSFAYNNIQNEDNFAGGDERGFYTVLLPGSDGYTNGADASGEITMFGADVALKYQGLSIMLEGFYQHADLDGDTAFANDFGTTKENLFLAGLYDVEGLEVDNYGWVAQAGYFLVPKTFELVSRVSGVCVESSNDSYEYAGGWNYYLSGQDLKLSMDITYIDDLPITSSSANYNGVQNNALFLVRTQLQFQF